MLKLVYIGILLSSLEKLCLSYLFQVNKIASSNKLWNGNSIFFSNYKNLALNGAYNKKDRANKKIKPQPIDSVNYKNKQKPFDHATPVRRAQPENSISFIFRRLAPNVGDVSKLDRKQFVKELQGIIPNVTSLELANIVVSLSSMNIMGRSKEMMILNDLLLERMESLKNNINAQELSLCLTGFAKLGIRFSSYRRGKLPFFLTSSLPRLLPLMDSSQVSNSVWALGKLSINWDYLPLRSRKAIGDAIILTHSSMTSFCVANTIHGLSNMRAQWRRSLPISVSSALSTALVETLPDMKEMETSNSISGLGRLGANWGTLLPEIRVLLGKQFLNNLNNLGPKGLAQCVHGLGRMNADIRSLPSNFRDCIMEAIERITPEMNALEVSNILYGLGKMGADFTGRKDLSVSVVKRARSGLIEALTRESWQMTAQGIANSLWGLMQMNTQWTMLPTFTKKVLLEAVTKESPRMDEQALGNTLFSLGQMRVRWRSDIPRDSQQVIMHALEEKVGCLTSSGLVMSLLGLGKMQIRWQYMPGSLRVKIAQASASVLRQSSERTLSAVLHALGETGASWESLGSILQTSIQESIARSMWENRKNELNTTGKVENYPLQNKGFVQNQTIEGLKERELVSVRVLNNVKIENKKNEVSLPFVNNQETSAHMNFENFNNFNDVPLQTARISSQYLSKLPSASAAALLLSFTTEQLQQYENNEPIESNLNQEFSELNRKIDGIIDLPSSKQNKISIADDVLEEVDDVLEDEKLTPGSTQLSNTSSSIYTKRKKVFNTSAVIDKQNQQHYHQYQHFVYALGQMGTKWEDLGISAQLALSKSLILALPTMKEQGVVNTLHGLSSMQVKWTSLNAELRNSLLAALSKVAPLMGEQGVSVTVLSLARLEVCWGTDLSEHLKSSLRKAIARQADLGEHALSNLLYGLGKLSRPWDDLHPDVRQTLKAAIVVCHIKDRCTPQGVANSLFGLAHMEVDWTRLSSSVRLALKEEIRRSVHLASESQLSSMVSSLGKLGVQWWMLPENLKNSLLECIKARTTKMNEQHLSNVLFALGTMGLKWDDLPTALKTSLTTALLRVNEPRLIEKKKYKSRKNNFNRNSNNDGSSGIYEIDEFELPGNGLVSTINEENDEISQQLEPGSNQLMNAQGLSMSVVGLSKLQVKWTQLDSELVGCLEASLTKLLRNMNSAQLASTLNGLSQCNWRWDNFKDILKKEIVNSVHRVIVKGTEAAVSLAEKKRCLGTQMHGEPKVPPALFHDLSLSVKSMGSLGLNWPKVAKKHSTMVRSMNRVLSLLFRYGGYHEVSGALLGMGLMDAQWELLPEKLREDGIKAILRLYTPEITPTLKEIEVLPTMRLRKKIIFPTPTASTRSQALANTIYGLILLIFDMKSAKLHAELDPVHLTLLSSISTIGVMEFDESEKEQILIYIHLLTSILPTRNSLEKESIHPPQILRTDRSTKHKISKLQSSVVKSLESALRKRNQNLVVYNEYSPFDGAFPVDATIFEKGQPVAFVEIDGPQHFHDGVLSRKDVMKEALYRYKHPSATFTRVRYDQVDFLGPNVVGCELANFIESCLIQEKKSIKNKKEFISLETTDKSDINKEENKFSDDSGEAVKKAIQELEAALDYKHKR